MKTVLIVLSVIGLLLTIVPAFLVWQGDVSWDSHARLMLGGTVLWFATAPFWMESKKVG
jgi:hypothetical protein